MTASLDVASLWLMWAHVHTCRQTCTHMHTRVHAHADTPSCRHTCAPISSHDPVA